LLSIYNAMTLSNIAQNLAEEIVMPGPKRRAVPSSYPPALLTYKVVPNAVAYSESGEAPSIVTFVITVSNPSPQEVPCNLIAFHFRSGSDDGALVSDPDSIDAASTTGVRWSITHESGGAFTAMPEPPDTGIAAGGAISFKFSKARINSTAGTGTIDVYEESGGLTRATSLPVTKQRPGLSITEFMADPVQVAPGENTVLRWATTGAQGVTLTWSGNELKLDPNGNYPIKIENTTTFTLGAEGKGDPVYQQVTATVAKPTILYFQAEPDVIAVGGASNLKWKSQNANRGLIKPGDIQVDPSNGQWPVAPKERQQYELTVWRDGASYNDSRTTTLDVKRVVIERLVSLPETVPLLGKAKLEWSTRWADKVEIQPDIGEVPVKGEREVSPQCDTVYEITAHGPEGPVRQSVTVRVDIGANLPLGVILAYAGPAPSALEAAGWLVCKGRALSTQQYRCLHKAIGNNFGAPRAGEFCLPDLERNFLRGVDAGAGRDPDARFRATSRSGGASGDAVGSRQDYGTARRGINSVWNMASSILHPAVTIMAAAPVRPNIITMSHRKVRRPQAATKRPGRKILRCSSSSRRAW
jgi:microcystin-dependent protein